MNKRLLFPYANMSMNYPGLSGRMINHVDKCEGRGANCANVNSKLGLSLSKKIVTLLGKERNL